MGRLRYDVKRTRAAPVGRRGERNGEGGGAVTPCVLRTTLLGGAVAPLLLLDGDMEWGVLWVC